MFKLIKFLFVTAFIFGGWALASLSLHVVRAPVPGDKLSWLPGWVEFVPKSHMTWKETWVDTTKWTANDMADHPDIVAKLYPKTREAVAAAAAARGIAVPDSATTPVTAPVDSSPVPAEKSKSIFDFRK